MKYDNRAVTDGVRSSTSVLPKKIVEDINWQIRTLEPEATPLYTLGQVLGTGSKPTNHKVQVTQYHAFDHYDYCSNVYLGADVGGGGWDRFARLTLDQPSRPSTGASNMFYQPRDKFYIASTGQVVEVVVTPRSNYDAHGTSFVVPTVLAGTGASDTVTTGTSTAGTVVVRNITPDPIEPFSQSDVVYLGNAISESQDILAEPSQRDILFDCNYVEHHEKVITMTEDQYKWVQTHGSVPEWSFQQREAMKEMKKDIDYLAFFGERAVNFDVENRPTRHMRGLLNSIQTNVAYYNPNSTVDFELMFANFLHNQAFRYNPNGKNKIGICGPDFLFNFNMAFREFRRTTDIDVKAKKAGLDIDTYKMPSGYTISLTSSEVFRRGTAMSNWCFIIDPMEAEWRIVKDFSTRPYQLANQRDIKLMMEWQGTIAWHLEQSHALLRT